MDSNIINIFGKISGLSGLSLGFFFILVREMLKHLKKTPGFTKNQWYKIVVTLLYLSWSLAVLGILCWLYTHSSPSTSSSSSSSSSSSNPVEVYSQNNSGTKNGGNNIQEKSSYYSNQVTQLLPASKTSVLVSNENKNGLGGNKPTVGKIGLKQKDGNAFIADFTICGSENQRTNLSEKFLSDFEYSMIHHGPFNMLARADIEALLQKLNEKWKYNNNYFKSFVRDNSKLADADLFIFGEVCDDIDSGHVIVTCTVVSKQGIKLQQHYVTMSRGKAYDIESRREMMKALAAKFKPDKKVSTARFVKKGNQIVDLSNINSPKTWVIFQTNKELVTWKEAEKECVEKKLRLPTIEEIESLGLTYVPEGGWGYIDPLFPENQYETKYWTATKNKYYDFKKAKVGTSNSEHYKCAVLAVVETTIKHR